MWVEQETEPELTRREQQVLELVASGYSAKEVANQIGIAPRTAERHIENVRLKMRAKNRPHLVTQAVRAGYLKIEPATEPEVLRVEVRENGAEASPLLFAPEPESQRH